MATPRLVETVATALEGTLEKVGLKCEVQWEPIRGTKLVRLYVVSKDFNKMMYSERQSLVWRIAEKALPEDQSIRLSMILTLTPEEADESDAAG